MSSNMNMKKTLSSKRGPGRPKKVASPSKRGPGRPKKLVSSSKVKKSASKSSAKRGPGRPKKVASPSKRGPGRPKKVVSSSKAKKSASKSKSSSSSSKRGSSKPKKVVKKSASKSKSRSSSGRKPGRPRKSQGKMRDSEFYCFKCKGRVVGHDIRVKKYRNVDGVSARCLCGAKLSKFQRKKNSPVLSPRSRPATAVLSPRSSGLRNSGLRNTRPLLPRSAKKTPRRVLSFSPEFRRTPSSADRLLSRSRPASPSARRSFRRTPYYVGSLVNPNLASL